MPRFLAVFRATALSIALGAMAACGRADAAARSDSSATAASTAPASNSAAADSIADATLLKTADKSRLIGPESAMWVVMISDFQCPYCKQWHDSSMAQLTRDYITPGKIRFAYLHLPLESIHPHARAEAQASLCAGVQGKFWEYADALFANYNTVKTMSDVSPLLSRLAKDLTLDVKSFDRCRVSAPIASLVSNDIAQASQAGVESTPSFIVGSFLVKGAMPYKDFRKAIDTALAVAKSAKAPKGAGTSAPTP
ncbi:DsbA family protein [Gemmatimonas sp.]|uniref:DsbA family protein n=1 Tax=Gemmatimonas sp. TaxID=1962908 RepID=UPI00333E4E7C